MNGLWDLTKAAKRMKLSRPAARRRLHDLHAEHGGLLFRAAGARNTKLWVDPERLFAVDPKLAGRISDLSARVEELEQQVAELAAFRAKANEWLRRQGR